MSFLSKLLFTSSVSQAIFLLCIVIATGIALGQIRIAGFKLGMAGVLFAGIAFAHFGLTVDHAWMEFVREFGLILFVYTIGLQVGPGFVSAFRRNGLQLNTLAALIVLSGAGIAAAYILTGALPTAVAIGLLSGATTNTPSLGAAEEAIRQIQPANTALLAMPGVAYAMAYPFGIMGIILSMVTIRKLFGLDPSAEAVNYEKNHAHQNKISSLDIEIEQTKYAGQQLGELKALQDSGLMVSRVLHDETVQVATPQTRIVRGDIIHVVGQKDKILTLARELGSISVINLRADVESELSTRRVVLSRSTMAGMTVEQAGMSSFSWLTITRVDRADIELAAHPQLTLQFADTLTVVGQKESLDNFSKMAGDSAEELEVPMLIPLFLGIVVGIVLGKIPIRFPGIPSPVQLGLAGGPLLAAIVFSHINRIGPLIWYMPRGANLILREFGIALFLACVGLRSGESFIPMLLNGDGIVWMGWGAVITVGPLLITGLVAHKIFKLNYLTICGLLSGSMTDPPALAFATAQAKSPATPVAYATVYPLVMILRVISAQLLVIFFLH